MGLTGSIIIYVMIWWIVFFSVLPVGIQSNKEIFKDNIEGIDPGAPKNPKIVKKFFNNNYNYFNTVYYDILSSKVRFL